MKIAIAALERGFDSKVAGQFARCPFFIIHDTDSGSTEFLPNPNKELNEDAGKATVAMLHSRNITKIISGDFGMKTKSLLDSLFIQLIVITDKNLTARQIIKMIASDHSQL